MPEPSPTTYWCGNTAPHDRHRGMAGGGWCLGIKAHWQPSPDFIASEHAMRDAMTDEEFWPHVLQSPQPPLEYDPNGEVDVDEVVILGDDGSIELYRTMPCPECGELGACSYDTLGRALIHVTTKED